MSHGVLLDVDGTLVDTNYLHAVTWAEAFAQQGITVPTSRAHALIGKEAAKLVAELGGAEKEAEITAAHTALYAQHHGHLRPLPGARELVQELGKRGIRTVLATSASHDELRALEQALDVDVDGATSADDVDAGKPAPDVLQKGRELLGTDTAVLLGDSVWDGKAAERAGIPFVAVLTGGTCEDQLRRAGALEVWADTAHLLDLIDDSVLVSTGQDR